MPQPLIDAASGVPTLLSTLAAIGRPLGWALLLAAAILATTSLLPRLRRYARAALGATVAVLLAGEAVLAWFHIRLSQLAAVVDPGSGFVVGHVRVPLWVESEKLYVWALSVGVMSLLVRRQRDELMPALGAITAGLVAMAVLVGKPFTSPLPDFLGQYSGYLQAMSSGVPQAAFGAYQGMYGSMTYYYNAWFMWVHPPLLFLSYGAFVVSFVPSLLMMVRRHASYEATAYWWARLGYLPLTVGMLLGYPWAVLAWGSEAWWWSGKVNMSIMMWLLYTAYLHGRLYLRRRGMWKVVAALAILSFIALVLTYVTTYVVPGAHSVA